MDEADRAGDLLIGWFHKAPFRGLGVGNGIRRTRVANPSYMESEAGPVPAVPAVSGRMPDLQGNGNS